MTNSTTTTTITSPSIVETIKAYVAQADINSLALRQRILDRAATANNDLKPVIDKYGRLHAPCDGYFWEENIYPGGAYLPYPPDFYEMLSWMAGRPVYPKGSSAFVSYKTRLKVTVAEAGLIAAACAQYAIVKKGKIWDDGETCYVYIETVREGLDNLLKDFAAEQAAIAEAEREARYAAKKALKGEAPTGRVTITGKVIKLSAVERERYHYYDSGFSLKMLVELPNKSTVYGNVPAALHGVEEGELVEFAATFERPDGDDTHAFFKRPSKAKFIEQE